MSSRSTVRTCPWAQAQRYHRAKRSVLIDLKKKEGLEIFWKIVDQAT
jgi:crotonobetainyl-CoA:carnitine CoA-transferase CaiB-like acyl-CoA transferase